MVGLSAKLGSGIKFPSWIRNHATIIEIIEKKRKARKIKSTLVRQKLFKFNLLNRILIETITKANSKKEKVTPIFRKEVTLNCAVTKRLNKINFLYFFEKTKTGLQIVIIPKKK
jgi:hypothetical protein